MSGRSPHFPDAFHRVAVKGLYVREGKVLLAHDFVLKDREPVWELPGGGLEFGESIPATLEREVREETGLEVTRVAPEPTYIWTARLENYRDMEWFYALVLGFRFDIKDLSAFVPSDECREYRFFSKEELCAAPDLHPQSRPFVELFNPADFA